jgi:hypothetical protein
MISGIIFILISWGVLKILFDFIKIARREIENDPRKVKGN